MQTAFALVLAAAAVWLLWLPSGESLDCQFCGLRRKVCGDCSAFRGPIDAQAQPESKILYLDPLSEAAAVEQQVCLKFVGSGMLCNGTTGKDEDIYCCPFDQPSCANNSKQVCAYYRSSIRVPPKDNRSFRFPPENNESSNVSVFLPLSLVPDSSAPVAAAPCSPCNSSSAASSCSGNHCSGCRCKKAKMRKSNIFIVAGIVAAGTILLTACLFLLATRRRQILRARRYSSDRAQILADQIGSQQQQQTPTVFTLKELKSATKSFSESRLLGGGGFSTVYQGKLPDGRIVAVKKLNQANKQGIQQFQNEVSILSMVRHPNLVQLLGYCLEGRDLLLVYEFVLNGTLADHLHGQRGNGLPFELRLSIALETAQALAYLHFFVNPPIYHRDVKSSNILLDKDFRAKVADFGLSRLTHLDATHISTAPQGTPGYLDPDYHESYQLTDKSDVYSFGVVLLELISRKRAVDMNRDKKEINLASMALAKIHCGALHELFDPDLSVKYWKLLSRVVEVAFRCLAAEKDDRPTMLEVVAELEQICSMVLGLSSKKSSSLSRTAIDQQHNRNGSFNSAAVEQDSPTSVQIKWPSTHTSPNNSRSEAVV